MSRIDHEAVKAVNATSTATLVTGRGRVRGLYVRDGGTAGTVVLKDGGASGTTLLTINTPAQVGAHYVPVPGGGIPFATDLHATLTQADGVTVFYGSDRTA